MDYKKIAKKRLEDNKRLLRIQDECVEVVSHFVKDRISVAAHRYGFSKYKNFLNFRDDAVAETKTDLQRMLG